MIQERLTEVYRQAMDRQAGTPVPPGTPVSLWLNNGDRAVVMSDLHRGVGDHADDYLRNAIEHLGAVRFYLREGYWYIENGDGEELWENRSFEKIKDAYPAIYDEIEKFRARGKYVCILGNHNRSIDGPAAGPEGPLARREGLLVWQRPLGRNIFLVHGNQGDWFNDAGWKIGRWFVRYVWRPLQLVGIQDPTSASKNAKKHEFVESELIRWARENKQILIAGHTHRAACEYPYFNAGSWIGDTCSAIEIASRTIRLVEWKKGERHEINNCVLSDYAAG